jgi:transcriptional regulator with XRE-family HTH domain
VDNAIHIFMEDRIRKFMEYKGISASELADSIGVQRSNVTHVLKARNKPSFQFIEKMLQIYPDLNAKWLLLGTGNMVDTPVKSKTLFDQLTEPVTMPVQVPEKSEEPKQIDPPIVKDEMIKDSKGSSNVHEIQPPLEKKESNDALKDQFFSSEKQIERMIVFFTDQTFKVYSPSR